MTYVDNVDRTSTSFEYFDRNLGNIRMTLQLYRLSISVGCRMSTLSRI